MLTHLSKEAIAAAFAEGRIDVLSSAGIPFSVVEVEARRAAALRDDWLHTGDIGSVDHAGLLTLKDRAKDVREVAVVGLPDDEWGEIIAAYVVADASDEDLDSFCLGEMARFKRPRRYLRRDSLPKNSTGKPLKRELREIALEH